MPASKRSRTLTLWRAVRLLFVLLSFAGVLTATSATAPVAAAGAGKLYVIEPSTIDLTGFLDQADSLVRTLTLRAQGGDIPTVTFLPSNLTMQAQVPSGTGNELIVDSSQINFIGGGPIADGQYATVQVKFMGLTKPGTYTGTLRLLTTGQTIDEAIVIRVRVIARERPLVTMVQAGQLKLQVTQCNRFTCWLVQRLFTGADDHVKTTVSVTNSGEQDATIVDAAISAPGTVAGKLYTATNPGGWKTLPAGKTTDLTLTVDRAGLDPDHYVGSAVVAIMDKADRITIPVDLAVRADPVLAFMILLLGIVLGRVALDMQDRGYRQASQLSQLHTLRRDADSRLTPADRTLLNDRLSAVADQIYNFDLDQAGPELVALRGAAATLDRARRLETAIASRADNWATNAVTQLGTARGQISIGEDSAALQTVTQLVEDFNSVPASEPVRPQALTMAVAANHGPRVAQALDTKLGATGTRHWLSVQTFRLAGIDPALAAEARLTIIRPLLLILLVVILACVGLAALYLGSDSFGAKGFADYLGLLLWGLGADVARRTLVGVAGGAPSGPATVPA